MNNIILYALLLLSTLVQSQTHNKVYGIDSGIKNFTFEEVFGNGEVVVHNTKIGTDFSAKKSAEKKPVEEITFGGIFTLPKEIREQKKDKGITFGGIFSLPKEDGNTNVVYGKDDIRNISFETMFDQPNKIVNENSSPTFQIPFDLSSDDKVTRPETNQIPRQGKWSVTVNPDSADKRYVVDYINGIQVSVRIHHKNGKLKSQTDYKKNLPTRKTTYNNSEIKLEEYFYRVGSLAKVVTFYESGEAKRVYQIKNNLKVASLVYYKSGEIKQSYTYNNGLSNATTSFYKSGEKRESASIVDGFYIKGLLFNKAGLMTNSQTYAKGEVIRDVFYKSDKNIDKIEEWSDGYLIKRHIYHGAKRVETRFFKDFFHNKSEFYYESGELGRIDAIVEDQLVKSTLFYKDGKVGQINNYVDAKRTKSADYDRNGLVSKIRDYSKGKITKATYYKNKDFIFKTEMFRGGLLVRSSLYYDNGKTHSQKTYTNEEHSKTTFYSDKGTKIKVESFKNGKANKVTFFGVNGRVLSVKSYTK